MPPHSSTPAKAMAAYSGLRGSVLLDLLQLYKGSLKLKRALSAAASWVWGLVVFEKSELEKVVHWRLLAFPTAWRSSAD